MQVRRQWLDVRENLSQKISAHSEKATLENSTTRLTLCPQTNQRHQNRNDRNQNREASSVVCNRGLQACPILDVRFIFERCFCDCSDLQPRNDVDGKLAVNLEQKR